MSRMGTVSKPVLNEMTDTMPFGEFKGQTVRYILDHRPSYIVWLDSEEVAIVNPKIVEEATELDFSEEMGDYPGHNYSSYYDDEPF